MAALQTSGRSCQGAYTLHWFKVSRVSAGILPGSISNNLSFSLEPHYLSSTYTPTGSTVGLQFTALGDNAPYVFWGQSNQGIPEPTTMALGAIGGVAMLGMLRRRRR